MHLGEQFSEIKPVEGLVYNNNANAVVGYERSLSAHDLSQVPLEWPLTIEPRATIPDEGSMPSTLANDRGR